MLSHLQLALHSYSCLAICNCMSAALGSASTSSARREACIFIEAGLHIRLQDFKREFGLGVTGGVRQAIPLAEFICMSACSSSLARVQCNHASTAANAFARSLPTQTSINKCIAVQFLHIEPSHENLHSLHVCTADQRPRRRYSYLPRSFCPQQLCFMSHHGLPAYLN